MKILPSAGAKVDMKTYSGYTPLHLAVEKNHLDAAEPLLSYGADPNAKASYKQFSFGRAK